MPEICGYCVAGRQVQGGRACPSGYCLIRARLAPFPYTHDPEMFRASSPSSLSQYDRKMHVWEIPPVGLRTKVNRNSGIQENKSTCLDRLLITFTFDYRCIHFFVWTIYPNIICWIFLNYPVYFILRTKRKFFS